MLKSYFCPRNTNGDQKISLCRKERRKIIKYLTTLYTKNSKRNIYLKEYDWSIPINIKRVGSSDNKYDIGLGQILDAHSCGEQDSITISVGDCGLQ